MFLPSVLVLGLALVARWWLPIFGEHIAAGPSPLDGLDAAVIPAEERIEGLPEDLVAVLGSLAEHRGHRGAAITQAAFSADGRAFVTAGQDERIVIWDRAAISPRTAVDFRGHLSPPALALGPGGETLAAVLGNRVTLWDLRNGRPEKPTLGFPLGGSPLVLAFTPDGKRIASASDKGQVQLGSLDGNAIALADAGGSVRSLAATADGKRVAVWAEKWVRTFELVGDRFEERSAVTLADSSAVVFAPDLETFAAVDEGQTVRLLETATGKQLFTVAGGGPTVAFRADGKLLALMTETGTLRSVKLDGRAPEVGPGLALPIEPAGVSWAVFAPDLQELICATTAGTVALWDLAPPKPRVRGVLQGPKRVAHAVAFAPDGRTLAVGGLFPRMSEGEAGNGGVELWNLASLPPARRATLRSHTKEVTSVAFSPNGRLLISGSDERAVLWDLVGGPPRKRATLQGAKAPVAFAPDSKTAATASGLKVQLWDRDGDPIRDWVKKPSDNAGSLIVRISALAFAPDGTTLAVGTDCDNIELWPVGGPRVGKPSTLGDRHRPGIGLALAISPDGKRLAAIGAAADLELRPLADGKPKGKGIIRFLGATMGPNNFTEAGIAVSPNSRYVAVSLAFSAVSSRVVVCDAATGKRLRNWSFPGAVHGVAFAPDSRHLAVANANGTVYLLRLGPPSGAGPSANPPPLPEVEEIDP